MERSTQVNTKSLWGMGRFNRVQETSCNEKYVCFT